jgi:hypothetical protein
MHKFRSGQIYPEKQKLLSLLITQHLAKYKILVMALEEEDPNLLLHPNNR